MCKEKATRNGNGNSRLAEQLGIIRGKNIGKKTAYLKCHNLMPEVLPELFKSCRSPSPTFTSSRPFRKKLPLPPETPAAVLF